MTPPTPDRSLAQRTDALARANHVRVLRSQLKRDVKAGRVQFADVLADPPDHAAAMKTIELLLAVPKVGKTKANAALRRAGVSPSRTIGVLTIRQRYELTSALPHTGQHEQPRETT